ncbi:MAG: glycosyltransferase family 4 protein [Candidatus Omnitrophica bacterium]|nr:glycosyltransferase family 4 protein [Candidatus Omnitrophota bacterium]
MKIIFVSNTSLTVRNFRVGLMQALKSKGHDVVFCSQDNGYAAEVAKKGFGFIPLTVDRKGMNLFTDLKQVFALYRIYRRERPAIVLHYTIKPNIYGSIAAMFAGVPCINSITGLGYVFIKKSPVYFLVQFLYKISCRLAKRTFFQNKDDLNLFLEKGLIDKDKAVLVNGSGVDVNYFSPDFCRAIKRDEDPFVFLFTGRFLWDKGVGEFVSAARITRQRCPKTRFWLAGIIDSGNPAGIDPEILKGWEREGAIECLGEVKDVREFICRADCVVLPSYREGIPRSLLEASAMEKPIITTDAVGCREVVEDGINGFSVPVKDAQALAGSFGKMIKLSPEERIKMGKAGRAKVKREFEENLIVDIYLKEIKRFTA